MGEEIVHINAKIRGTTQLACGAEREGALVSGSPELVTCEACLGQVGQQSPIEEEKEEESN